MISIKRTSFALAVGTIFIATGGTAGAQKAGTYSGTALDGTSISMTVTGTGPFTLANASVNFKATCPNSTTINEGWGFFLGDPISGGGTDFQSSNDYYYINGSLNFPNNNTIKGSITSRTAVFVPGTTPPAAAEFCKSGKQSFVLKFQSGASAMPIGGAVVLGPSQR